MRWGAVFALVAAGCHFRAGTAASDGDVGADGSADAARLAVAHVAPADVDASTSTATWTVSSATTLDTGAPTLPGELHVAVVQQVGGGPDLLLVQAAHIELGADLTVIGTHPLVLVATEEITIASGATLRAAAVGLTPGSGGAAPSAGIGAGNPGSPNGGGQDAGGAGGSFGTQGAAGGNGFVGTSAIALGGTPMAAYGDDSLVTLQGGSGGGDPSPMCPTDPRHGGAGGGAIQLTSPAIAIDGVIDAGGGGGETTNACSGNGLSGGGGGSGGAIYIQTAMLSGAGALAANGGGGAGSSNGSGTPGIAGEDAHVDSTPAAGGAGQFGSGGAGAALAAAQPGESKDNGGGGGGGDGRIFLAIPAGTTTITSSPAAARAL